jgi:hypothetical protein
MVKRPLTIALLKKEKPGDFAGLSIANMSQT